MSLTWRPNGGELADNGDARGEGFAVAEPAPGWTVAGPYAEGSRWRAFRRDRHGAHRFVSSFESYEAAAAYCRRWPV